MKPERASCNESSAESVVVLGASAKPERYSFRAMEMLSERGHRVCGVHPLLERVGDIPVYPSLLAAKEHCAHIDTGIVDTVTVYLSPARSLPLADQLLSVQPTRVILNPGTESAELQTLLESGGIQVQHACTLVLLTTGQF